MTETEITPSGPSLMHAWLTTPSPCHFCGMDLPPEDMRRGVVVCEECFKRNDTCPYCAKFNGTHSKLCRNAPIEPADPSEDAKLLRCRIKALETEAALAQAQVATWMGVSRHFETSYRRLNDEYHDTMKAIMGEISPTNAKGPIAAWIHRQRAQVAALKAKLGMGPNEWLSTDAK